MNDTSPEMEKMVAERYKLMTPDRRMRIASSMFETARAIKSRRFKSSVDFSAH